MTTPLDAYLTVTFGTSIETSPTDGAPTAASNTRCADDGNTPCFNAGTTTTTACARGAPPPESARGLQPSADMLQMTQMFAAATTCSFFACCYDRNENAGRQPAAATRESVTQQPVATMNTEQPQRPREQSDLSFLLASV